MTSTTSALANLPAPDRTDKDHFPLSTGRAHTAVRKVIDRAALECSQDRSEYLLNAGVEKAVSILGADVVRDIFVAGA